MGEKSNDFIAPVQCALAALALPFLSAAYGFEQMLIAPFATLAIIGYMLYKKNTTIMINSSSSSHNCARKKKTTIRTNPNKIKIKNCKNIENNSEHYHRVALD